MSGFANRPKILKGAFVEYGLTIPPLMVLFQFNPVQLQRTRSLTFNSPNETGGMREWHRQFKDLSEVRENQIAQVEEEKLNFELRLDASDALNDGNPIAVASGVTPALSTLELMTYPKSEGALVDVSALLGPSPGYRYTPSEKPPLVLFIWGVQRVLPVNIDGLTITETEFDTLLNPVRATVAVNLTVIEGNNPAFKASMAAKQAMSVLNVANVITDIVIPG